MKQLTVLLLLTLSLYAGADGLGDKSFDLSLSVGFALPGIIQASFEKDYPPA